MALTAIPKVAASRERHFERPRAPTKCLDYAHHFFSKVIPRAVVERHVGAFARKHLAQRRADPAGSTSYKNTLSFEQQTHSYSLPTRDTAANFFNQLRALKD